MKFASLSITAANLGHPSGLDSTAVETSVSRCNPLLAAGRGNRHLQAPSFVAIFLPVDRYQSSERYRAAKR